MLLKKISTESKLYHFIQTLQGSFCIKKIIGPLFLIVLAMLTVMPIFFNNGWPQNHEYLGFIKRTLVYSQHLQQGDWFPVWSSTDNLGFGSPFPAFYHKLFYTSSGILYLLLGEIKLATIVAIIFWLVVGGMGMRRLCALLGCTQMISWCGAYMFVLSNYTVTDWLIRGAMAELSAMMLVPWCFSAYLMWINSGVKHKYAFIKVSFCISLVCLAHTLIAYYLILLLLVCTALLFIAQPSRLKVLNPLSILMAAVVFICAVGPYIYFKYLLGPSFSMEYLLGFSYLPENNLKPAMAYLWDSQWAWGSKWDSLTIQIDTPLLLLLLWGICVMLAKKMIKNQDIFKKNKEKTVEPISLYLILGCMLMILFLQTPLAILFYKNIPGASYIQFPWRLLALLTPLLIAFSLTICSTGANHFWGRGSVLIATIGMIFLCGSLAPIKYPSLEVGEQDLQGAIFGVNGVYVPMQAHNQNISQSDADNIHQNDAALINSIKLQLEADLLKENCTLEEINNARDHEELLRSYRLKCANKGLIPLPLFGSKMHKVEIKEVDKNIVISRDCIDTKEYSGVCVIVIDAPGEFVITVKNPQLKFLLF